MDHNEQKTKRIDAFTLVETVISMALISIIFLMVMQSFNSLLLGSYLIDARTSVRDEGEFIGEYFKLRVKNADTRSLKCDNEQAQKPITWQTLGSSDTYTFYFDNDNTRFCVDDAKTAGIACDTVLTYNDVIVKNVVVACATSTDEVTGQQYTSVNLQFDMDSALLLGNRPAVRDVSRFISVSVR